MRLERTEKQLRELIWLCNDAQSESRTAMLVLQFMAASLTYKLLLPHHPQKPYIVKLTAIQAAALTEVDLPAAPVYLNQDVLDAIWR